MAKQLRQARAVLRAARDYVRHDLPEIVFPSSMPTPPGLQPEAQRSSRDYIGVFWRACRRYVETWDSKKMAQEQAERERERLGSTGTAEQQASKQDVEQGPGLAEEFAAAAKGGSQALKPFLANLYQTRAMAYKNAVQQFVEGYKQGFQQAMAPEVPPDVAGEVAEATGNGAADAAAGSSSSSSSSTAVNASDAAKAATSRGTAEAATSAAGSKASGEIESPGPTIEHAADQQQQQQQLQREHTVDGAGQLQSPAASDVAAKGARSTTQQAPGT